MRNFFKSNFKFIALGLVTIIASATAAYVPYPVSSAATKDRSERIDFGGSGSAGSPSDCTSTPCTIYQQSGSWVASITRNGTGDYSISFAANTFTSVPTCNCTAIRTASGTPIACGFQNKSSSAVQMLIAGVVDANVSLRCQGPR